MAAQMKAWLHPAVSWMFSAPSAAPIVKVFIDWLFASLEEDGLPEPQTSARMLLRTRGGRTGEGYQPVSSPRTRPHDNTRKSKTRA